MPSLPIAPSRRTVAAGLAATLVGLPRLAGAQPSPASVGAAAVGERILRAAPLQRRLRPEAPAEAALWA
jgi:hypothetical protein